MKIEAELQITVGKLRQRLPLRSLMSTKLLALAFDCIIGPKTRVGQTDTTLRPLLLEYSKASFSASVLEAQYQFCKSNNRWSRDNEKLLNHSKRHKS